MKLESDSNELRMLYEFIIELSDSKIPDNIERSIFYPRLKMLMFKEINLYCREKLQLKADLQFLRMEIGAVKSEPEIRSMFEPLLKKYNSNANDNIGVLYHLEEGRLDYSVVCTVLIKRSDIEAKNFIFRYKKRDVGSIGLNFKNSAGNGSSLTETFLKGKDEK